MAFGVPYQLSFQLCAPVQALPGTSTVFFAPVPRIEESREVPGDLLDPLQGCRFTVAKIINDDQVVAAFQ